MSMCILNWYSDRGFELDLDAEDEDIALRLAAVAVPADGTGELQAGVELDRLEILFKAHVDVSGEPGQIVEAKVILSDQSELAFIAKVEDVETGEILDFKSLHKVRLPTGVPESGGPRPRAQSEDELDWEDETTLEKMIVAAPETTRSDLPKPTPLSFDEEDEEPTEKPGKGLQALLKALVSVDEPGAPEHAPTEPEVNIAALLGAAKAAEPPEPEDQAFSPEQSAKGFLELLIARDALEIEDGHELTELIAGTVPILEMRTTPERQASVLSEWLLEQPAVADLFVDDEELGTLLEQW